MTFFELVGTLLAYAIANEGRVAASQAEAEEQAIIAEAAAAVARESSPLAITRALRGAVSRFIPAPYVSFGFLEEGMVEFVTREGPLRPMNVGEHFTRAFTSGQAVVPATASRLRAGESLPEVERIGVQAHLLTTAYSAGAVVGLLLIGSREESFVPGEREARFCRLIADIVGPAMANARAAQRQRWEAEDQRILAEVGAVAAARVDDLPTDRTVRIPRGRLHRDPAGRWNPGPRLAG
jgi:GAF domain-containing protein